MPARMNDEERAEAKQHQENLTTTYTRATARLRDKYLDEFNQMRAEEAKKLGV